MEPLYAGIYFCILLASLLSYFKVADRFNIIDKPNERSSHAYITIRGGGIVFYFGALLFFLTSFEYVYFTIGLTLLAFVSFLDDINPLPSKVRIVFHFGAVLLLMHQLGVWSLEIWLIVLSFVIITGILNAYNFMDGINGITGIYSLVCLGTLYYYDQYVQNFMQEGLALLTGFGVLIFLFFNYRKKAKCFAGDIGSMSIAFVIVFLVFKLMFTEGTLLFILLLGVYGVDSVLTIIHRLLKRENIFQPHRFHLYQILVNQHKYSHRLISFIYGVIQLLINVWMLHLASQEESFQIIATLSTLIGLGVLYIFMKWRLLATAPN